MVDLVGTPAGANGGGYKGECCKLLGHGWRILQHAGRNEESKGGMEQANPLNALEGKGSR